MPTVGSLFAGIGGFDLGFERNGFEVRWQAEQDKKAQAVLSARFPTARLYDDVRTVGAATVERVDVICGGFPCQDVSVAGKRAGLGGERTGLFSEVVRIARELEPRWMVLENVPGLLSSHGGRDVHTVLSALAELGFRRAYRILDSRYFGVAQRRRRVFIVLRARRCGNGAEEVLFEPQGGGGDSQTGAETRARVAATLRGRSHGAGVNMPGRGGEDDENLVSVTLQGNSGRNHIEDPSVVSSHAGAAIGVHANQRGELRTSALAGSLNGTRSGKQYEGVMQTVSALCPVGGGPDGNDAQAGHVIVPERARALVGSIHKRHDDDTDTLIPTLSASMGHHGHSSPRGDGSDNLVSHSLTCQDGVTEDGTGRGVPLAPSPSGVRRLTPLECERLQGFPDGWTCLCGNGHRGSRFCTCSDSPRYRQLGNAVTVPVAAWIARRILEADK